MIGPIKLNVEKEDQRHVDALVYAHPKKQPPIEFELAGLFHRALPRPIPIGYDRVPLRWVTPQMAPANKKG
jgi:hypothetical protein